MKQTAVEWLEDNFGYVESGNMTLRDYFAAKALNGICANSLANYGMISNNAEPSFIAQRCYKIADAMLKEKELLEIYKKEKGL